MDPETKPEQKSSQIFVLFPTFAWRKACTKAVAPLRPRRATSSGASCNKSLQRSHLGGPGGGPRNNQQMSSDQNPGLFGVYIRDDTIQLYRGYTLLNH